MCSIGKDRDSSNIPTINFWGCDWVESKDLSDHSCRHALGFSLVATEGQLICFLLIKPLG